MIKNRFLLLSSVSPVNSMISHVSYESGGYLSIVPLCYILYGEVRGDDGRALLVSVVYRYKELLSHPVGSFSWWMSSMIKGSWGFRRRARRFSRSCSFCYRRVASPSRVAWPSLSRGNPPIFSDEFIRFTHTRSRRSSSFLLRYFTRGGRVIWTVLLSYRYGSG